MARLELTPREHEMLSDIVIEYLADLKAEIRETDDFRFKMQLKDREEVVKGIVEKLSPLKVEQM